MLATELPFTLSVNHYYRHVGYRTLISGEGRMFRRNVFALLASGGPRRPLSGGRIALCLDAFSPDRRPRHMDNIQKPILDALQHVGLVLRDHSQTDVLVVAKRRDVVPSGRLDVALMKMPLLRCLLCGRAMCEMSGHLPKVLQIELGARSQRERGFPTS